MLINEKRKGKFTLILDSSQLVLYDTCPQKWVNTYVKRLEPLGVSHDSDEAMNAGTYGHKLLDIYYRAKTNGFSNLNEVIVKCFSYNPDIDTCECGCLQSLHRTIQVLGIDECSGCGKCTKFHAKRFNLSEETRSVVRNRFRDYTFKYQLNDIQPISNQHVEVGFSEPIYEDPYNLFVLEGRIDLIGRLQGLQVIMDHKFQLKSHWLYPKSIQFKNYAMVSKISTFIVNYVRLQKTIQPDSLSRDVISFTGQEMRIWKERLIRMYFDVKNTLETGIVSRRWGSCSGAYMTFNKDKPKYCWYGPLCEEIDEIIQERKEKMLYQIKPQEWKPW